jgi:hypothetical protein
MACPFFYPTERLDQTLWPHPARLPLGAGFAGICRARRGEDYRPNPAALRDWCNLGYGAAGCGRFPEESAPEAVRFAVRRDADGVVQIQYVVEKGHLPWDSGTLEFEPARGRFRAAPSDALLARQAQVYLDTYLERRYGTEIRKGIAV